MFENSENVGRPMAAWHARLGEARTEADVVDVARGYLRSWPAPHIDRIPQDFQPGFIADAVDIKESAVRLTRAYRSYDVPPRDMPILLTMMAFFNLATARLAEVAPSAPPARFSGRSMGSWAAER